MPFPETGAAQTEGRLLTELTLLREKVEDGKKSPASPKKEIGSEASALTYAILETAHEPLLILDVNLCIQTANRSFYRAFNISREETENRRIYDLEDGQWSIAALHRLLEEIIPRSDWFDGFQVKHDFKHSGNRTLLFNARRLEHGSGRSPLILLAIEDITGQNAIHTGPAGRDE